MNYINKPLLLLAIPLMMLASCEQKTEKVIDEEKMVVSRTPVPTQKIEGMSWIPGGEFVMGTNEAEAYPAEKPAVDLKVEGFWMDTHEVTNDEFAAFVEATDYVTVAERKPEWEELKNNFLLELQTR